MTWQEKLNITADRRASWSEVQMFFDNAPSGAPEEHVSKLRLRYSFLPDEYLNLLRVFDGLDIAWIVFFGSGASKYPAFETILRRWNDRLDLAAACPIAEDAGGSPLLLHEDGKVTLFLADSHAMAERRFLCTSFDVLMDEGLFGPKFTQILYGRAWIPEDDGGWVGYLKRSGWY